MKVKVNKLQMGGAAPAEAQAAGGQASAEQQIVEMARQIVGQLGNEGALALAQAIAQVVQEASQGAPAGGQQIAYQKKGGKLVAVKK